MNEKVKEGNEFAIVSKHSASKDFVSRVMSWQKKLTNQHIFQLTKANKHLTVQDWEKTLFYLKVCSFFSMTEQISVYGERNVTSLTTTFYS
jgi:hypothetical protein